LAFSGTGPNPRTRPIGFTRLGPNVQERLIHPAQSCHLGPNRFNQPDNSARVANPGVLQHLRLRTSWDYPGSKGHDARYQTRSCIRSLIDGTSPTKDRAPRISGRGPEISVHPMPRLHQLPIPLCAGNQLTAPKNSINTRDPSDIEVR
jgi:hypothetical protein